MQTPPWQQALSQAFTDLPSLLSYLQLSDIDMADAQSAIERFGLRVPREFAALMRPGDPEDPLLKQVLPLADELASQPGYTDNPVGDREAEVHPGLLHKYHGRALVIATGACAVNCRYCFRRHYPYENGSATPRQWERILDYLHREKTIDEVILSGGDPLMMSDEKLEAWLTKLSTIPHLKRVRLHTRLPVVLPQRINQALVESLTRIRLQTMMVIHVNHPNEISPQVAEGMAALKDKNITLLNQSVLLKGVNDDAETLISVSERLFSIGVLPYYLHLLDRVAGAAHFDVEWRSAQRLYKELQAGLPGYLVPKMVREIAGEKSKTLVQALTE